MFSGIVPANVINLPVELSILWILKCFSPVKSSNISKVDHLVDPVIESVSASFHIAEHW